MFEPPKSKVKSAVPQAQDKPAAAAPRPLKANQQEWTRHYSGTRDGINFQLRIERTKTGHLHARYQVTPGKGEGWHLEGQLREDNSFVLVGTQNEAFLEGTLAPVGPFRMTRFQNKDFKLENLVLSRIAPAALRIAARSSTEAAASQPDTGASSASPAAAAQAPLKVGQEWERWYTGQHEGVKFHVLIQRLKSGQLAGRYQVEGSPGSWPLEGELRADNTFELKGTQNGASFKGSMSARGPVTVASFERGDFKVANMQLERSAAPIASGGTETQTAPEAEHMPEAGSTGIISSVDGAEKRRIIRQQDWGTPIGSLDGVSAYYNDGDGVRGQESQGQRHYAKDKKYEYGLKWQCVEYIRRYYYDILGVEFKPRSGNAQDYFQKGLNDGEVNSERHLKQFNNGGTEKPAYQDIIVMGPNPFSNVGHVAIIAAVSDDYITLAQQNVGTLFSQDIPLVSFMEGGKNKYKIGGSAERLNTYGWMRR